MQGKVEICGVNTARLKTLSAEQMEPLLKRAAQGDDEARQSLIEGNLRLVLSVIQRFDRRGESPDDLFQVGCIGLMKAVSNFDPEKCVRFSTYGVPMIAGEIRRYLRDNSSLRVSRSLRDMAYRVMQARESLMNKNQREPSVDELAAAIGTSAETVAMSMDAISAPVSLFDPVYTDAGESVRVMDQVRDTKNTDQSWLEHIAFTEAVDKLAARERRILALRYLSGKTQMEVAGEIGISQAQVSRLEKNAVNEIKKALFPV